MFKGDHCVQEGVPIKIHYIKTIENRNLYQKNMHCRSYNFKKSWQLAYKVWLYNAFGGQRRIKIMARKFHKNELNSFTIDKQGLSIEN